MLFDPVLELPRFGLFRLAADLLKKDVCSLCEDSGDDDEVVDGGDLEESVDGDEPECGDVAEDED